MNARAKKLRDEALELPAEARAKLAHELILSLEEEPFEPQSEVEEAWAAEIERRVRDVKDGRVKLIPAAEALRDVRASLKRVRARERGARVSGDACRRLATYTRARYPGWRASASDSG